jgi:predicted dehydrogenase
MNTSNPLRLAFIGCGARGQTYAQLTTRRPDRFELVAAADPLPGRVEKLRQFSGRADFRGFASAEALEAEA